MVVANIDSSQSVLKQLQNSISYTQEQTNAKPKINSQLKAYKERNTKPANPTKNKVVAVHRLNKIHHLTQGYKWAHNEDRVFS